MSTFALVVIGVGACIGVLTSLLLRPDEPATLSAPLVRGPRQPRTAPVERGGTSTALLEPDEVWSPEGPTDPGGPGDAAATATTATAPRRPRRTLEGEPNAPTPWWQRLRSLVELASIAVVLGVLTAAAIGLAVVALFGLLRGSVG